MIREKGVASGVISGYGTDRRSEQMIREKGVARYAYPILFVVRMTNIFYYEKHYINIKGGIVMIQNDNLKRKVSKKKVVIGVLFTASTLAIGGLSYKVYKQRAEIKNLQSDLIDLTDMIDNQQVEIKDLQSDVGILKSVMNGNIIHSLKETTKRKLRYAEGRLTSGIEDGVMSIVDINKRKEEIEFFSEQLAKYDEAERLLNQ